MKPNLPNVFIIQKLLLSVEYYFFLIYFREHKSGRVRGRGREREKVGEEGEGRGTERERNSQAESTLRTEPSTGLDPTILG